MLPDQAAVLRKCFRQYQDKHPALAPYSDAFQRALEHDDLPALIIIYHAVYPLLEQEIWNGQAFHSTLDLYQSLFREQEALIQRAGNDQRYHFILSIPVADRPQHVKRCLESIYRQCADFAYSGLSNGTFAYPAGENRVHDNLAVRVRNNCLTIAGWSDFPTSRYRINSNIKK